MKIQRNWQTAAGQSVAMFKNHINKPLTIIFDGKRKRKKTDLTAANERMCCDSTQSGRRSARHMKCSEDQ